MSTITVTTACGTAREFDSRHDAERGKQTHLSLCEECDDGDVEIAVEPEQATLAPAAGGDGAATAAGQSPAATEQPPADRAPAPTPDDQAPAATERAPSAGDRTQSASLASMPDSVGTDPLDVVPEYMITEVEGQPTINKRGYAVIAHHFDIAVQSEAITTAGETDHEYAEFRATAWQREDGPEAGYTGHGTARASEDRSGIENNLNEMAETRAMKRAVSWASGVGVLAWEEMLEYLEE